ncbi:MAG: MBL fold metallo-hydrolase [Acidimicrobiia bacterium]|nr:MBL fold metallo-hydrolase [Acidimicrobiia bacterium]
MTTIRRLADSCLVIASDSGTTLIDPGAFSFDSGIVDLDTIGDVQKVLITHEHSDHVKAEFVRWLIDRGDDVTVHANQAVADLLAGHDIEVLTGSIDDVTFEDVVHEVTPLGTSPPNRSFTVDGVLTHPGDSYQPVTTGPVLALPLLTPWGSTHASMEFARRLAPSQAVPIHDFYVTEQGKDWIYGMCTKVLADSDIELVALAWGDSYTL